MQFYDASSVNKALAFNKLIPALSQAFQENIIVPPRLHFDIENPNASRETTLLMMPAWQAGDVAGVKLVTVAPENTKHNLPSIQGTYLLFDVNTGTLKATMDAPSLTAKRTAAASALASSFLSRKDSSTLLMIGTGTLSPQLIKAHATVRPIKKVLVWGRDESKAATICQHLSGESFECSPVTEIQKHIEHADIISCATLSKEPLVFGKWLNPGQHLDMVGAYRPDMREMDDECLLRGRIFIDNFETALRETGDLAIPIANGVIKSEAIKADLFSLCKKQYEFTRSSTDITIFKSVGHALEDLAAAKLVVAQ